MNILIPTIDYPPIEGGIGTLTLQLSRELAGLGHQVTVIAPDLGTMDFEDDKEPARIVRFRGYGLGWLRFFPLLSKTLGYIREADMILGINVAYGGVIGLLSRKPYITFAYAYEFLKFHRTPFFSNLLRRVYRKASCVVAISRYTRDRLAEFGVAEAHITIAHPGANVSEPASEDSAKSIRQRHVLGGGPIVLSVGRLIARKNQIALVEAMPQILDKHPDAMLVLAGRGPMLSRIARRAGELGIREHVALPGKVPDDELAALYGAAALFALPCKDAGDGHVEGFGLVFAEANAYGKPVVAGRSGGVEDAVLDGETGILVDPEDVNEISKAITGLLDDPDLVDKMGAAGRARIDRELNWSAFAATVAKLCEAAK